MRMKILGRYRHAQSYRACTDPFLDSIGKAQRQDEKLLKEYK